MRRFNCLLAAMSMICFCLSYSEFNAQNICQAGKPAPASLYYNRENLRSDTFDILKYWVDLEVGSTNQPQLKGNCRIRFAPKMNNRTFIRFDLLKLIVDSVKENNSLLTYSYNDTVLRVNFAAPKGTTDTSIFTVFYRGNPVIDATGWGGFYYNNAQSAQYAYNLGVGFGANPHNYGRVWFPCFDNFVEKSKYEYFITCDSARRSFCNGQLMSDQVNGAIRTRRWVLNEQIPTYLASVAVANYAQVNWIVNTLNGPKPITLVSVAADTTAMKNGFVNLKNCITGFENYFGPYMWNRFGYCIVPFNGGAMEHATSITYPRFAIGNTTNEGLMSHELSHHWFGNLITCETPEDMWINEGMATFSAYMFYEWQYGKQSALNQIKSEHDDLVHFLHKKEGWRAISGVPHSLTYGDHVYKKGADVAHTMRGYLGDSAFFAGLKYVLQQKAYQNVNSNEFRDLMQIGSGKNLNDFFNNWIFSPGWSHFSVDSVKYVSSGSTTNAIVSIRQKTFGTTNLHTNVPLELTFFQNNWNKVNRRVTMSGGSMTFTVNIPFVADYCAFNFYTLLNDASSHEYKVIKNTGGITFTYGKATLLVTDKGADSSLVRIIHSYVKADPFKNSTPNKISDQHYWKVEGLWSQGFNAKTQFNYNGYFGTAGAYTGLDTSLVIGNGDSLALFYRPNAGDEWSWQKNAVKTIINAKSGYFTVDSLRRGEYAFGLLRDSSALNLSKQKSEQQSLSVFPNPAQTRLTVKLNASPLSDSEVKITSIEGKQIMKTSFSGKSSDFDVSQLPRGTYTITVTQKEGPVLGTQKIVLH